MRSLTVLSVLALFVFALALPATALTFKVFDSKTGDALAGATVAIQYLAWMPKAERHSLSALTNNQGVARIDVPVGPRIFHTISYSVDREAYLFVIGRGMIGDESIIVRLDQEPFAGGTPGRTLPALWRERDL